MNQRRRFSKYSITAIKLKKVIRGRKVYRGFPQNNIKQGNFGSVSGKNFSLVTNINYESCFDLKGPGSNM